GDPLFPATRMGQGASRGFEAQGLARHGWTTTTPIRDIFRRAFAAADLPYFNPHSFRDMLVRYAMTLDLKPEQMKAWSQNLGHADVLTTFTSYGNVPAHRRSEEHTSELQSRVELVCRLLLEKKNELRSA